MSNEQIIAVLKFDINLMGCLDFGFVGDELIRFTILDIFGCHNQKLLLFDPKDISIYVKVL